MVEHTLSESARSAAPTGTVVFLFSDVEGSTGLWQEHPQAMREALALHQALLQASIAANSGYVFQIVGDGLFAAFPIAMAGLAAAAAAQRALAAEAWGETGPLRARMALHAGPADLRPEELKSGQYASSLTLSRTSRLLAAAHGGQILVSATVEALTRDQLAPDMQLRDLGVFRLRDLPVPEHIYQLTLPGLRAEFPPVRSPGAAPTNLPTPLTSFVGRERELQEVKDLLAGARLLTLTGSGGTGKTRLALQAAGELGDRYPDGAWLVELAPISDPTLVTQTIASALGVRDQSGHALLDMLKGYLLARTLLLILDNCEHLLAACAAVIGDLLRTVPGLTVLTTSREPLGVAGEVTYRVPSLSLPEAGRTLTAADLMAYEAVHLFVERARAVQPAFHLTYENAGAIVLVCRRLDGIPLAIELAATRVRSLSVEQIAERLDDYFRLLTGGSRTAMPRQQTLRAMVDWSHDLLTAPERVLLRRLSVFSGGFDIEAAEAVCADYEPGQGPAGALPAADVLDVLAHLVDRSLVVADTQGIEARYRLLEMIRQYAREKLQAAGEGAAVRDRHLAYYLRLAEESGGVFFAMVNMRRLELEQDNLRTAMDWSVATQPVSAVRMGSLLVGYWVAHGLVTEGRRWLADALQALKQQPDEPTKDVHADPAGSTREAGQAGEAGKLQGRRRSMVARGLAQLGYMNYAQGDYVGARRILEEGSQLAREPEDREAQISSLSMLGQISALLGDPAEARAAAAEGLALARAFPDRRFLAMALYGAGEVARLADGDYEQARAYLSESLKIWRDLEEPLGQALCLIGYGFAAYRQGLYDEARAHFRESMAIFSTRNERTAFNYARSAVADVDRQQGHYDEATHLYQETLAEWRLLGNLGGVARCIECLGFMAAAQGSPEHAAQLWGAASALRGAQSAPMTTEEGVEYAQLTDAARAAAGRSGAGSSGFEDAWTAGQALTPAQAIEYALA
jgi:predicted ATPase/class 3 adenylate cyclase